MKHHLRFLCSLLFASVSICVHLWLLPSVSAAPVEQITLDISKAHQDQSLTWLEGHARELECLIRHKDGTPYRDLKGWTGYFQYGATATGAAFAVISSTNFNRGQGSVTFSFTEANLNTNGTWLAYITLQDASSNDYWAGTVDLVLEETTISGVSSLVLQSVTDASSLTNLAFTNLNFGGTTGFSDFSDAAGGGGAAVYDADGEVHSGPTIITLAGGLEPKSNSTSTVTYYNAGRTPLSSSSGATLTLPTDGTNAVTHPSIVAFPTNWPTAAGYRYFLAYSGYPPQERESTFLAVSRDGVSWSAYNGGDALLFDTDTELGSGSYFYDPEIFVTTGNVMVCWTPSLLSGGVSNQWNYKTSTDGITWSSITNMGTWHNSSNSLRSLSAVQLSDDSYRAYKTSGDFGAGMWDLEYITVDGTGTNVLSDTVVAVESDKRWLWHGDVWLRDSMYYALFIKSDSSAKFPYNWGIVGTSTDGATWRWQDDAFALPHPHAGPGSLGWYMADVVPIPDRPELYDVIAGGWHSSTTYSADTEAHWRMTWIRNWSPSKPEWHMNVNGNGGYTLEHDPDVPAQFDAHKSKAGRFLSRMTAASQTVRPLSIAADYREGELTAATVALTFEIGDSNQTYQGNHVADVRAVRGSTDQAADVSIATRGASDSYPTVRFTIDQEGPVTIATNTTITSGDLTVSDGDVTLSGTLAATTVTGDGSGLTAVDAATGDSATDFFDAGTIADARLSDTVRHLDDDDGATVSVSGKPDAGGGDLVVLIGDVGGVEDGPMTITSDQGVGIPNSLTVTGLITSTTGGVSVPTEVYGAGWNADVTVPTKDAVYDKIETLSGGHDAVTLAGTPDYITLTDQVITRNEIDEADLKAVDAAADEDFLTYETTTGDFEWHSIADVSAGIAADIAEGELADSIVVSADIKNGEVDANDVDLTDDYAWTGAHTGLPYILALACSDESTALSTGTAKATFRMPDAMTVSAVRASVTTAPVGSVLTVDINEGGTTILSTKLTIDATEETSTTAAAAAVISDAALADDAEITIDIDTVGSGTAGAGLKVYLIGTN